MSKRSYRRLAAVAGTALALGSMAPAMALRVGSEGDANVEIETIDVTGALGDIQDADLLPLGAVVQTVGTVRTVVSASTQALLLDVFTLLGDVQCVADAGLGLGVNLTANVGLGVGLGGIAGSATGLLEGGLESVADVQDCVEDLAGDAIETALGAVGTVQAVGGIATSTALGAVALAGGIPGVVVGTVTPLLLQDILTVTADATLNAVLGAGVASLF